MAVTSWLGGGTGRCGTRFTAKVFNAVGLDCTHEEVLTWRVKSLRPLTATGEWTNAAPLFFDRWEGPVIWQLRAPADAMASLVWHKTFTPGGNRHIHFRRQIKRVGVPLIGDVYVDAQAFMLAWWRLWEARADMWWRVEDLEPAAIVLAGELLGRRVSSHLAGRAIVNHRGTGRTAQRLEPLPVTDPELADLCEKYGYTREGRLSS